jgi:hypothetical protein
VEPGDVLMRAGRPVLVVPPGVSALEGRRVLVAWKDTRETRRAVADALPLLVRAEEGLVLEVVRNEAEEGEQARARADDAAAFLARHGALARGAAAGLRGPAVADEVLFAAERHGADLVRRRRLRAHAAARMGVRRRHAGPAGALPDLLPAEPLTARPGGGGGRALVSSALRSPEETRRMPLAALEGPFETLEVTEPDSSVLLVKLNRPERANAFTTRTAEELLAVFSALEAEPDAYRCVVLTGTGDRAFCAGADLKERDGMTDATSRASITCSSAASVRCWPARRR